MASEYAHCYGGDASREYLSVEDATSNGGDTSREYFSVENATIRAQIPSITALSLVSSLLFNLSI